MNSDDVKAQVEELSNLQGDDWVDVVIRKDSYLARIYTKHWYVKEQKEKLEKAGYVWRMVWLDAGKRFLVKPSSIWVVVEWDLITQDAYKEWKEVRC